MTALDDSWICWGDLRSGPTKSTMWNFVHRMAICFRRLQTGRRPKCDPSGDSLDVHEVHLLRCYVRGVETGQATLLRSFGVQSTQLR